MLNNASCKAKGKGEGLRAHGKNTRMFGHQAFGLGPRGISAGC